jgi:4-aminobutyrate aminotransferase-like enzyme
VAGSGCYLYSSSGSGFLDCVNNVTHVGHSHPHVTQRISEQQRLINTNSVTRTQIGTARAQSGAGRTQLHCRSLVVLLCNFCV